MDDLIKHPRHYTFGTLEVREVIRDWGLDWCRANALKYIARAPFKGTPISDIDKAIQYLTFYKEDLLNAVDKKVKP